MSFEIGQTVVYPHHGAATIEEVMTRTIFVKKYVKNLPKIHQKQVQHQLQAGEKISLLTKQLQLRLLKNIKNVMLVNNILENKVTA